MVAYRLYKINILLFSILLFTGPIRSETRFNSAKLREIYLLMPDQFRRQIDKLDSKLIKSFVIDAMGIIPNQRISVRYNKENQLVHLGIRLISTKPADDRFQVVYDYVERTLLNMALIKDKDQIIRKMSEDQLQIKYNKKSLPALVPPKVSPNPAPVMVPVLESTILPLFATMLLALPKVSRPL